MEVVVLALLGGAVLAFGLWKLIWVIVSQAVDNFVAWAIYTFGYDQAVKRQKEADDRRDP